MKRLIYFVLVGSLSFPAIAEEVTPDGMAAIPSGLYLPLYSKNKTKVAVGAFYMDIYPVTNGDFLKFVKKESSWRKTKIKKIFSEKNYLESWSDDLTPGKKLLNRPVTYVSWFAAQAYCESLGKSLPSVDQWEYIASLNIEQPEVRKKLVEWYSKPTEGMIPPVGSTFKNKYGVYDIYGLIWEWTLDFNTAMVTGESRADSGLERNLFCGSGSIGSSDFKDYASFMRFAYRSSLKAAYVTANLGFRCVKEMSHK